MNQFCIFTECLQTWKEYFNNWGHRLFEIFLQIGRKFVTVHNNAYSKIFPPTLTVFNIQRKKINRYDSVEIIPSLFCK